MRDRALDGRREAALDILSGGHDEIVSSEESFKWLEEKEVWMAESDVERSLIMMVLSYYCDAEWKIRSGQKPGSGNECFFFKGCCAEVINHIGDLSLANPP